MFMFLSYLKIMVTTFSYFQVGVHWFVLNYTDFAVAASDINPPMTQLMVPKSQYVWKKVVGDEAVNQNKHLKWTSQSILVKSTYDFDININGTFTRHQGYINTNAPVGLQKKNKEVCSLCEKECLVIVCQDVMCSLERKHDIGFMFG